MPDQYKGKLDDLRRKLYRRGEFKSTSKRARFSPQKSEIPSAWQSQNTGNSREFISMALIKKIFLGSIAFFILVVLLAFLFFFRGSNVVSSENIDISVVGPISVKGGEVLSLEITVTNRNPVALEFSDLEIDFPAGTRDANDTSQELSRPRIFLDSIRPGESKKETIRAILFGKENTEQEIKISLDYRTEGSNAIFVKEKPYKINLTSSPISMVVSVPEDISSGQDIQAKIEINSHSTEIIGDVLVDVDYPSGFSFIGATPAPTYSNNVWRLGDLSPSAERKITIRGILEGQDNEVKPFKVTTGTKSLNDERTIGTPYSSSFETITVKRPFVGLSFSVNGNTGEEIIASPGTVLRTDISWANNLPNKILNGEIFVLLDGEIYNRTSVYTHEGFYRSSDDTIVWDKRHIGGLASVEPGRGGSTDFKLSVVSSSALRNSDAKNPQMKMKLIFKGQALTDEGGTRDIEATLEKTVKLNSQIQLASRAIYSTGPFTNSGPMPPRANQETTYTIVWNIINSSNNVENVVVRATLPSYVRWVGQTSPSNENITYNPSANEVVWQVGSISRSTGLKLPNREVAFQVGFGASLSHVNQIPVLLNDSKLSGRDGFTGSPLSFQTKELNIRIFTDPSYADAWSRVTN